MSSYFHHERREIRPLLPSRATKILEIGAASGQTLRWLKTIYPAAVTTGVELNPEMFSELGNNADIAVIGAIDECLSRLAKYDLVLLLDLLEHLPDPVSLLHKIQRLLEPGGRILVSVPNVAHLSVSMPLLLRRRFAYQDSGILDRTHLRFFVEGTAIGLLNEANFVVSKGLISGLQGSKAKLIHYLSFGLLRHHLAKQYIMLGETMTDGGFQQPVVEWLNAK